jgi:hypothetical protein
MTNSHSALAMQMAYARSAIDEGAGIARIVEYLQDARMLWRRPHEFALVGARAQPTRERKALFTEEADGSDRASNPFEGIKHHTDGILYLGIGVEADRPVGLVDQSDRGAHLEFTASRLVELATAHARF